MPDTFSENVSARATLTSFHISTAIPRQSNPGPIFALVAGTRTTTRRRWGRVGADAIFRRAAPSAPWASTVTDGGDAVAIPSEGETLSGDGVVDVPAALMEGEEDFGRSLY